VADGHRHIVAVVVYTPTDTPTAPCGACRQVLSEFGHDAQVVCACQTDEVLRTSVRKLLPDAFGPGNLRDASVGA
jgi:cytidine deaminase